jgi:6-phosphogluconate dehydrogenase
MTSSIRLYQTGEMSPRPLSSTYLRFLIAFSWFDGYRNKDLPANLLQAQRDYVGAQTFNVKPEFANEKYKVGENIDVNWTGRGGNV